MAVEGQARLIALRRIEAVYAGIDWLTLTVPLDSAQVPYLFSLWQRTIRDIASEGNELKQRSLQGYQGQSAGNCFVGERHDGIMLQLTGAHANEHFKRVWRSDCKVPRVDCQVTVRFRKQQGNIAKRGYDALTRHRNTARDANKRKFHVIRGSDGGDTLYIGARTSEQFGRVYNKAVQSEQAYYERCWRWETVFKNDLASQICRSLPQSDNERAKWIRDVVKDWFTVRGLYVEFGNDGEPATLPLFQPRRSDVATKLEWLEKQVKPTVAYLTEAGYGDSIYTALGLPNISETLLDDPGSVKEEG